MTERKLLYIGNKLSYKGSTVTSIETLGAFLSQEGWKVITASSKQNKGLRLADMLWTVLRRGRGVRAVLIDTYSTQNFYFAVAVANLCRLMGVPYIPILRGGNLPQRLESHKTVSWKLFNGAFTNVVPSAYLESQFRAAGYQKLHYIPNTIEIKNYSYKERAEIRPRLLWVRSFSKIYNPMLAMEVMRLLDKQGVKAELCMVGPDKDGSMEACKSFAKKHHLNVEFTGMLPKAEWISLAASYDIFINTTNFDNTPVSVIEAMALGLPVVSTDVGGMPFLIDSEKDGLLIPPNDRHAFKNAILDLLADRDLVVRLTAGARKKVINFDWEVVKDRWNALLEAVNN